MYRFDDSFIDIAKKIAENGGRMYLVGGAVRDMALNKEPHDLDFCVTGISADEFIKLFDAPRIQGKAFPVFIINGCEFALARKERKIGEKHTDFEVVTDKSITIEEDLARRDLTINSMALDVLSGEYVDPYNGMEDLKKGLIRMTTKAFCEDPLRVYRAARFAAKFGFDVSEDTLQMMESMKGELSHLSAERVCVEFRKALLTDAPSKFFETLKKADILDVHFEEIANLIGVEQPVLYHPEGDAYNHTMQVLDKVAAQTSIIPEVNGRLSLTKGVEYPDMRSFSVNDYQRLNQVRKKVSERELIRFCALVHDFGKASTPSEEWPHHYGHDERGIPLIKKFCKRIKMPLLFEKAGCLTSKLHMKLGIYYSLKLSTRVDILDEIGKSRSISPEGLEIIAGVDSGKKIEIARDLYTIQMVHATEKMNEKCTIIEGDTLTVDYAKLAMLIRNAKIEKLREEISLQKVKSACENHKELI